MNLLRPKGSEADQRSKTDSETSDVEVPSDSDSASSDLSEDAAEDGSGSTQSGSSSFKNPFFDASGNKKAEKRKRDNDDDDSEDDDSSDWTDTDSEDGEQEEKEETTPEDDLVAALKAAKEKKERKSPPDIALKGEDSFTDLSLHPQNNLVAGATIEGDILLYEYANEKNEAKKKYAIHKKTVRSIDFGADGGDLYSASKDRAIKITDVVSSTQLFLFGPFTYVMIMLIYCRKLAKLSTRFSRLTSLRCTRFAISTQTSLQAATKTGP